MKNERMLLINGYGLIFVLVVSSLASTSETSQAVAVAALTPDSAAGAEVAASREQRNTVPPLHGVDMGKAHFESGAFIQETADGRRIRFTVDPGLQRYVDDLFTRYQIPAGAAVVLNSRTGRVLALSQVRRRPNAARSREVALESTPPAASLFKMVTASALMEHGHIPLTRNTCYAGGSSRLLLRHITEPLPKNHACVSLKTALGRSVNAVFAKLSDRFLNREVLRQYAEKFYFNRPLEFDLPIDQSTAEIPADRLERARTAAGFWHTHLSPIHAAMIIQSIAQGGALLRPYVVDRVTDEDGKTVYRSKTKYLSHTVTKETADQLINALVYTTERGTARKSFHDRRGRPHLPGIKVAGKTGTLTEEKPYRAYTWFAGLAPHDHPEVAIAVLVVNEPKWRIKASQMSALILKKYFEKR